jgi:hypothetical protein
VPLFGLARLSTKRENVVLAPTVTSWLPQQLAEIDQPKPVTCPFAYVCPLNGIVYRVQVGVRVTLRY